MSAFFPHLRALGFILPLLLTLACDPPPDTGVRHIELGLVVQDSAVFRVIQSFQIHIIKATTLDGKAMTCSGLLGTKFRADDLNLDPILPEPRVVSWKGSTNEATVTKIQVPYNVKMIIIIKGLAKYANKDQIVAHGCQDNVSFPSTVTAPQEVEIDVKATTGAACVDKAECELNLNCLKDTGFKGGYCAKTNCSADKDCPPGSACVGSAAGQKLCARSCEGFGDCTVSTDTQDVQDCRSRPKPTGNTCSRICINPTWNAEAEKECQQQ